MPNTWIDISSVVHLQKGLLVDLKDSVSNSNAQNAISQIQTNLGTMSTNIDAANGSIRGTLAYQDQAKAILERENTRLNDRKVAIDSAYEGQKRMVQFTDSMTERQKSINLIIITLALLIFVFIGARALKTLQFIPDTIIDLITIALISIGIIYCIIIWMDILRRNKMNFNEINLGKPREKSEADKQKDYENNLKSGNLLKATSSSSCPWGTTYNTAYSVCIPNAPEGVTNKVVIADTTKSPVEFSWGTCDTESNTYDSAKLTCTPTVSETFANMDIKPFSAYEYKDYSAYK